MHFAGYKKAGESMEVPERYFDNNVDGTAQLLDVLQGAAWPDGVLVVVLRVRIARRSRSTRRLPIHPGEPLRRDQATGRTNPRAGTTSATACARCRLRYFNAAGASFDARIGEDSPQPLNLVPLAMNRSARQDPRARCSAPTIRRRDGTCVRDYIHVDDLADAHVKALDTSSGWRNGGAERRHRGGFERVRGARRDRRRGRPTRAAPGRRATRG